MTDTVTEPATAPAPIAAGDEIAIVPPRIADDIQLAIAVEDPALLSLVMQHYKLDVDSFVSADYLPDASEADGDDYALLRSLPAMRITTISGLQQHDAWDIMTVLPAGAFTTEDALEVTLRIAARRRPMTELGAISLITRDGRDLTLYGAADKAGERLFVIAPHPERAEPVRVISTSTH